MAIQTRRDGTSWRITDLWNRPIEWAHGRTLRLLDWFNQERYTTLLTILAVVFFNLLILFFLLQEQDNRAIAFTVLLFVAVLSVLVVEVAVTAFIVVGTQLFVNALYYAAPGFGTGVHTTQLLLLAIVSGRAIYEYLRIAPAQRPRLLTWGTAGIILFWSYYMVLVIYHYVFHYNTVVPTSVETVLGLPQRGLLRFMDGYQLWIGILPLMVLLRDWQRAKRVMVALGVIMFVSVGSIIWEYVSPMPMFFKVLFQLKAAGETIEGYRVRDPVVLYLGLVGLFFALYSLGYVQGKKNILVVVYILLAFAALLITKNRILWGAVLVFLPIAVLLKSPVALLRQTQTAGVAALFLVALLLHPTVYDVASRVLKETIERWQRTFSYGGNPTLDPAYQPRLRELETWREYYKTTTNFQRLFGSGFVQPYGYYIRLSELGYKDPRFEKLYAQKVALHFEFYSRLHRMGIVGTVLMYSALLILFLRGLSIFLRTREFYLRALVVGVAGATIGAIAFDSLHGLLYRAEFVPVLLLWGVVELIPHWQRTGQLPMSEKEVVGVGS